MKIEATKYATDLHLIYEKYKDEQTTPVFVIFITDGSNSDKNECEELIRKLSPKPVFLNL